MQTFEMYTVKIKKIAMLSSDTCQYLIMYEEVENTSEWLEKRET